MALCSLRLRRNLATLSALRRSLSSSLMISAQPTAPSSFVSPTPSSSVSCESSTAFVLFRQFREFRSSRTLLLSSRSSRYSDLNAEEIGPDTILFEGCDYKHWLIVMDFGKDNESKPTSEEMVRIYEETCAKGLNISVEEAKKRMYACSTTTYTGFQVEMTEEESEKFNGLDRVIFVLPDSYIDPVNKEYGGDKYINGTIIPRPPPIQYGRMGPRNRDRNRNPEQSRYRGNPSYNYQQGSGSNFGPSQNHPQQQNYNPASQNSQPLSNSAPGSQFDNPQQNYRSGLNYQPQQSYSPPSQSYQPQQNYGPPSQSYQPQQNYGPPSQSYQPQQNYGPPSQSYQPQQTYSPPSQSYQPQQNYSPPSQSYQPQQNYAKPSPNYQPQQKYGQTSQSYVPQQNNVNARNDLGDYPSQGATGTYRPGTQAGGAQNHSWNGEAQRFPQGQQRSMQGDQTNYSPAGQTENDPVRY